MKGKKVSQTTYFYVHPQDVFGEQLILKEEEARHAQKSLRLNIGDTFFAIDGVGNRYEAQILQYAKVQLYARILKTESNCGELPHRLAMGVALLKNPNRFETFLEKAVELGVTDIFPLQTRRTERVHFKTDRFERILIAALKQCGRTKLPILHPIHTLNTLPYAEFQTTLIPHEKATNALHQSHIQENTLVCIGPEGGFTDEEVVYAQQNGCLVVSLGTRRLRAETAAMLAAGYVSLMMTE